MKQKARNFLKHLRNGATALSAMLLLVLYVAGTIEVESLHQLAHQDEEITLHTQQEEANPCHRGIYHHDSDKGCDHSSHVSAAKKCPLCHFSASGNHLAYFSSVLQAIVPEDNIDLTVSVFFPSGNCHHLTNRGPPQLS